MTNHKPKKNVIKDKDLSKTMRRIRIIVGQDVQVLFKTTKGGSKLIGTYDPEDEHDDEPDEPLFDFNDDDETKKRYDRRFPKIKGRKKDLNKPTYFG